MFTLSCESTADYPFEYMQSRNIPVLFYHYTVNGELCEDNMGRGGMEEFYALLEAGNAMSTSQLNQAEYEAFFEGLSGDVLHIAFGSGMTNSVANARLAAEAVMAREPGRKIAVVDSLCSCSGYGFLVEMAADYRDKGHTMEETEEKANKWRLHIQHQFFCTDLRFYRRSGRVHGINAVLATVLNICPIMRLHSNGSIYLYDKVRGKKAARKRTLDEMAAHAEGHEAYDGICVISHADCPEEAEALRVEAEERFPHLRHKIRMTDIGPVIGCHCGPGTVAIYYYGDERHP